MLGKRLVVLFLFMKGFDALTWKSLGKTQLLGCVWFTLWLRHYPLIGIPSEFDRKYSSVSQDSAFFGLKSVLTSDSSINQEQAWSCLQVWRSPSACLALNWCITSVDAVPQQLFFQRSCLFPACHTALRLSRAFCPSGQVDNGKWSLWNQTFNGKLGSDAQCLPTFPPFPVTAAQLNTVQLETSLCPFGKEAHVEEYREGFWEQWRQLESQFKLAFRGLLMPNFCCLCTSRPFSAWGSASGCFCHERGVSVYCYCAQPLHFLLV